MKIIKINPNNPDSQIIDEAVKVLKDGGVIVYPTDTCYALGVDMTNIFGIDKIYKIKGRESGKPISVIVKSIQKIKKMAIIEEPQEEFIKKYLPGPLTVVLLNTDYLNFEHISIGIRIPKYKITQLIAEKLDRPYATTSANLSGQRPCYSITKLLYQFKQNQYQPDLILDAGNLEVKLPSTVVDLIRTPFRVLRQGSFKIDDINKY